MAYGDVLTALADPTRRRMFDRLRSGDRTVGELAKHARISQPAASQHLRILRRAKLVASRAEGTRRHYRATSQGLAELRAYIDSFWVDVLVAYASADLPDPPKKGHPR